MVRERYAEFHRRGLVPFAELNDARRKMATAAGRRPADRRTRSAGRRPSSSRSAPRAIVSLPGVPERARRHRRAVARRRSSRASSARPTTTSACSSSRAPGRVGDRRPAAPPPRSTHPEVYVKSRAKVIGSTPVDPRHALGTRRRRRGRRRAARAGRRTSCSSRSPRAGFAHRGGEATNEAGGGRRCRAPRRRPSS